MSNMELFLELNIVISLSYIPYLGDLYRVLTTRYFHLTYHLSKLLPFAVKIDNLTFEQVVNHKNNSGLMVHQSASFPNFFGVKFPEKIRDFLKKG